MIAPPGPEDPPEVHERFAVIAEGRSDGIGGDRYYGYRDDLQDHVARVLAAAGAPVGRLATLHAGPFATTLHPVRPVAFAHVDCDWHDAVGTCLERLVPALQPGGRLLVDDYHDWGGARTAADAFLERHGDLVEVVERHPTLVLARR
jgi:O-methyltransferase